MDKVIQAGDSRDHNYKLVPGDTARVVTFYDYCSLKVDNDLWRINKPTGQHFNFSDSFND